MRLKLAIAATVMGAAALAVPPASAAPLTGLGSAARPAAVASVDRVHWRRHYRHCCYRTYGYYGGWPYGYYGYPYRSYGYGYGYGVPLFSFSFGGHHHRRHW